VGVDAAKMMTAPPHGVSDGDPSTIPKVLENEGLLKKEDGMDPQDEQGKIDHEMGKQKFLEILERNKQAAIAELNEIRMRAEADPTFNTKQAIKSSGTLLAQLSDEAVANIAVTLPSTTGPESIYNTFKTNNAILQEFGELNDNATRIEMGLAA
jgi:hypothetical protein